MPAFLSGPNLALGPNTLMLAYLYIGRGRSVPSVHEPFARCRALGEVRSAGPLR